MSLINDETPIQNEITEYNDFDSCGFETNNSEIEGAPDDFTCDDDIQTGSAIIITEDGIEIPAGASINTGVKIIPINQKITLVNYNTLKNKQNKYLVIHYVGAESSAKANASYFYSENRNASAHYFVDPKEIWQVVKNQDMAWHVGASSYRHPYCRNSNSIGIELCVKRTSSGAWYYEDGTITNGIALARYIVNKYNIPKSNVLRHYDVTGKICGEPHVRNEKSWIEFRDSIYKKEDDEVVESVNYNINGKNLEIDSIVKNGVTYMAIAGLRNAGFTVEYENETKLRTIKNNINTIKVADGNNVPEDVNAININGNNFAKLRDLALVLGYSVNYDSKTGEIRFYK